MTDVPAWVEPAVNEERRRLRETPRLAALSGRVEAQIAAIQADPGRERGRSAVFRLPRHPAVRSSAVYGSGEGSTCAVDAGGRQGADRRDHSHGLRKPLIVPTCGPRSIRRALRPGRAEL